MKGRGERFCSLGEDFKLQDLNIFVNLLEKAKGEGRGREHEL